MIKYNSNTINDWNFGDDNLVKVYYHDAVCYHKVGGSDTPRLPEGYTEVEYIENTGTTTSNGAFINTGVLLYDDASNTFTVTSRLKTRYYSASADNTLQTFINSEGVSTPYNGFVYRYKYYTSGQEVELAGTGCNAELTTVDHEDGTRTVTIQSVSAATFTNQVPLGVFSSYNGNYSRPYRFSLMTLYSMKIVKNGTVVRDFVPAKRDTDSKFGLYDLITDTFYTSPNGKNFAGGNPV